MEKIDIYDENRLYTGKVLTRCDKLNDGEYKLSMHMWVVNSNNEIYIQKRSNTRKVFPSKWENPGGSVLSGESTEDALKREFKEELGIGLNGEYFLLKTIKRKKDFVDIYIVKQDFNIKELLLQTEEVVDCKWANIAVVEDMIKKGDFCPTIMDSFVPFLDYYEW